MQDNQQYISSGVLIVVLATVLVFLLLSCCCPVQVIVQDVPLDSYISMGRFLAHFQPQACILMVRTQKGCSTAARPRGSA